MRNVCCQNKKHPTANLNFSFNFKVIVFQMSVNPNIERDDEWNTNSFKMQHQQHQQHQPHQQLQQPQSSSSNLKSTKMEDGKRIQRVLDDISAKYADRKNGQQPIVMEEKAKQMLADYANELAASVLEAASLLADHRNSKTIDVEDVNLILSK